LCYRHHQSCLLLESLITTTIGFNFIYAFINLACRRIYYMYNKIDVEFCPVSCSCQHSLAVGKPYYCRIIF